MGHSRLCNSRQKESRGRGQSQIEAKERSLEKAEGKGNVQCGRSRCTCSRSWAEPPCRTGRRYDPAGHSCSMKGCRRWGRQQHCGRLSSFMSTKCKAEAIVPEDVGASPQSSIDMGSVESATGSSMGTPGRAHSRECNNEGVSKIDSKNQGIKVKGT